MKIFKRKSRYLSEKSNHYRDISLTIFISFLFIIVTLYFILPQRWLILFIFPPFLHYFRYFLKKWRSYSKGLKGEELVEQVLLSLDDSYFLINDFSFSDEKGNIDHIIVGPSGIFVVETKNYKGSMTIRGDKWYFGEWKRVKSASYQAKRNERALETYLKSKGRRIRVRSIVVLTDPNIKLNLSGFSSTPILKINELLPYLKNLAQNYRKFRVEEIESYAALILKVSPFFVLKEIAEELLHKTKSEQREKNKKEEKQVRRQGSKKLYVGNLNYSATNNEIKELFSDYGEVRRVNIIEGRGFGFVELSNPSEAKKAKKELDGLEFKGCILRVDEARPLISRQNRDYRKY